MNINPNEFHGVVGNAAGWGIKEIGKLNIKNFLFYQILITTQNDFNKKSLYSNTQNNNFLILY